MKKPLILHIDDDHATRVLVCDTLVDAGFSVRSAARVADGVEPGDYEIPDLILLDLMIPGIDGYQACEFIKTIPGLRHVPILMVTGMTDSAQLNKAIASGACGYITKPFDPMQLVETVNQWLHKPAK